MSRLSKLLALSPTRFGSLMTASILLAVARCRLAYEPIAKLIEELGSPINTNCRANATVAADIAWALRTAATILPWRADCLIRALAARHWAERCRLPFEFHLGVRFDPAAKLEAHAWSLSGGVFLSGDIPELARFMELEPQHLPASKLHFSD